MKKHLLAGAVIVVLCILAAVAIRGYLSPAQPQTSLEKPSAPISAPPAVNDEPSIPIQSTPTAPPTAEGYEAPPPDIETALTELLGRKTVLAMFQLDDFARRFVSTVDNLGRSHLPASLSPINPAEGRFSVQQQGQVTVISPNNALRYTPYVLLLETVDMRQAVALYASLYPVFQRAYEDIGFPKHHFNNRLLEVIDQMLETPESRENIAVSVPTISGPLLPSRPWVLYEFDDPSLQALTSGQKLLLRIGPVNQRRVKAKLAEIRELIASTMPNR